MCWWLFLPVYTLLYTVYNEQYRLSYLEVSGRLVAISSSVHCTLYNVYNEQYKPSYLEVSDVLVAISSSVHFTVHCIQ